MTRSNSARLAGAQYANGRFTRMAKTSAKNAKKWREAKMIDILLSIIDVIRTVADVKEIHMYSNGSQYIDFTLNGEKYTLSITNRNE